MKIYLVGGAVRDQAMGIEPKDRDYVVVGGTPEEMLAQGFEQVGADFPVFLHPVTREEYALARTERKNGVGYHGFDVTFDKSIKLRDDLQRRDLTINSMAREPHGDTLFDPFGGLDDLHNKVLRHTSDAFRDDPLRVIRLARFAARFPDFTIHPATMMLAQRMVEGGELDHLPPERFAAEIVKALEASKPGAPATRFFDVLNRLGVHNHVYFFKGMNMHRLLDLAREVTHGYAPKERAEAFAAMAFAGDVFTIKIGGSEAQTMRNLLIQNKRQTDAPTKAERLEKLCARIGYQSPGRLFRYMEQVAACERLGMVFEFDGPILNTAYHLLAPVSGRLGEGLKAMGKSGKEIGKEIADTRLQIAQVLVGTT
jgi:tRNA nucleotidyltransferase/poly(A) polymerase